MYGVGRVLLLAIVLVYSLAPNPRPVSQVATSVVTEIRHAIVSSKPEQVLQLLQDNGLGVNSQLTRGWETALHLAAELGKMEVAETLLGNKARVSVRDRKGETPLVYAQKEGHADLAALLQVYAEAERTLLRQAKTSDAQDLFAAAENGDRPGAELLLAEGADPKEKRHHGESTYDRLGFKTPFHFAFDAEHYGLAAFLLKEAQGINGLDEQGWTPVMIAIMAQDWDMVRELIRDGADLLAGHIQNALDVAEIVESEAQLVDIFVEERGANGVVYVSGQTHPIAKLFEEYHHNTEIVRHLQEHGIIIGNPQDFLHAVVSNDRASFVREWSRGVAKKYRALALTMAYKLKHNALVAILLEDIKGVNAFDNKNWTPLFWAIAAGDWELVRGLLHRGAVVDYHKNNNFKTAFNIATKMGYEAELVEALIDTRGVDARFGGSLKNYTLLMWAAGKGDVELVEYLLQRGADPDLQDYRDTTALIKAVRSGYEDIVNILIKSGADLNIKKYNYNALVWGAWSGHTKICKLLIDNGADPTFNYSIFDSDNTPIAMEATKTYKEVATVIRDLSK